MLQLPRRAEIRVRHPPRRLALDYFLARCAVGGFDRLGSSRGALSQMAYISRKLQVIMEAFISFYCPDCGQNNNARHSSDTQMVGLLNAVSCIFYIYGSMKRQCFFLHEVILDG